MSKEIQSRLERGYTMAIYGTSENIHKQMTEDIETLLKAINYSRSSLQLLCVNGDVDGLTTGKYYEELYRDRTMVKVLDDYGIESMFFSDRFIIPPSKQ